MFKPNLARGVWNLIRPSDGVGSYSLKNKKNNFGPAGQLIPFNIDFQPGRITISQADASEVALEHQSSLDITLAAVADLDGVATNEQVANWRKDFGHPITAKTVANHFTTLVKRGDIELDNGLARILPTIVPRCRDQDSPKAPQNERSVEMELFKPGEKVETTKGQGVVREDTGDRVAVKLDRESFVTHVFNREQLTRGTV